MTQNLTTRSAVKDWLAIQQSDATLDKLFDRLIAACSRGVLSHIARSGFFRSVITETITARETGSRIYLSHWPVISVTSVRDGGNALPPSSNFGYGYKLQPAEAAPPGRPQALDLVGGFFNSRASGVEVTYVAGYCVVGEAATVPAAPGRVTLAQPYGPCMQIDALTVNGAALVASAAIAPAAGQYHLCDDGVLVFNAAQAGGALVVSYSYTPADVFHAVTEWVGERYKYRSRIGVETQTLGGNETQSYNTEAIPKFIKAVLRPYERSIL